MKKSALLVVLSAASLASGVALRNMGAPVHHPSTTTTKPERRSRPWRPMPPDFQHVEARQESRWNGRQG
jgi:hypothetical protein